MRPGRFSHRPFALCLIVCVCVIVISHGTEPRPNVLFIAIDDLRNDLGCLGAAHAKTPNLDSLAAQGRLFTRHYTQVPTCGASRASLLRGRYPDRPAFLGNEAIKQTHAEWRDQSLPGVFRKEGYQTFALGKITHFPGGRTGRLWNEGPPELPDVWDKSWIPQTPWGPALHLMHGYANGVSRISGKSPPLEIFDGPDEAYPDAWIAAEAESKLRELAKSEKPWLFTVGFFKPHLPFAAPKKWFDLHDPAKISPPAVPARPAEPSSWHGSGEFRGNYGHNGRNPDLDTEYARQLRHAYAAATSYVDAQVGKLLRAFEELGLSRNTIVVVWGDHGFLLGEHAIWGKHTLYEEALRSPLIILAPGLKKPGTASRAIVESVDIFPTLADLCGFKPPADLSGRTLRPNIDNPELSSGKPAYGFWNNGQRTVRDERWRLISHPNKRQGGLPGVELFDYTNDPHESRNLATDHPDKVKELLALLDRAPNPARVVPSAKNRD